MGLSVEQLVGYKIPRQVIERWRRMRVGELLPLQETALTDTAYLRGGNLVVFAPTSSGKTFIGESAAAKVLSEQSRVIYLVPTKALAEEKFRYFAEFFSPFGFRVVISTSERQEADELVAAGQFDFLIAVYEKMKSYLVLHPQLIAQIGLIIVDELQMLGDASRGDVLDLILSKIRLSPYCPQLIGLSATLGDAGEIANWLGAELLDFHKRPVELREGVYNLEDGLFYYRCFNTHEEGEEPLTSPLKLGNVAESTEEYARALLYLVQQLAEIKGEQVLIFVPTKYLTRQWALELARQINLPEVMELLKEITLYEESYSRQALLTTLKHSIAFHNADLTWDLRALIEDYYDRGRIRVLFSTTTLGQGVNLSGRNVINVHQMVAEDEWSGEYGFVPLTRQRFCNQGGRSARFARTEEFGRSILIALNRAQAERLLKFYVFGELEPTSPPLANKSLEKYVVDLVATGAFNTREKINDFFSATYTGYRQGGAEDGGRKILPQVEKAIKGAMDLALIRENEQGEFSISGVGEIVAIKGIQPLTALRFKKWAAETMEKGQQPDILEVLLLVSFTPDASEFPLFLSYRERTTSLYVQELKRRLADKGIKGESIERLVSPPSGLSVADTLSIKKTLLLADWLEPANLTPEIEKRYQIFAGSIMHLGMHYNWLVQALGQVAMVCSAPEGVIKFLNILAERLIYGIDERGLALARLRVSGLTRTYIYNLLREGFDTPEAIAEVKEAKILGRILPERLAAELIAVARNLVSGERGKPTLRQRPAQAKPVISKRKKEIVKKKGVPALALPAPDKKQLIIDQKEPGIVWFAGQKIKLTPLPYRLLLLLAQKAERGATYEEIDEFVWPEAKVERQQVSAHKATLIRAFAKCVGAKKAKKVLETRSGFGLILNIKSSEIEIRS